MPPAVHFSRIAVSQPLSEIVRDRGGYRSDVGLIDAHSRLTSWSKAVYRPENRLWQSPHAEIVRHVHPADSIQWDFPAQYGAGASWSSSNSKQRSEKAIPLPMVKLSMESINLSLTVEQVKALLQISQNQLFRMKFLDPKMPGYKARPGEVEAAESAVQALTAALQETRLRSTGTWENPTRRGRLPRVG